MNSKQKVIAILLMKYKIVITEAITMGEKWLKQNPHESWSSLNDLLINQQVIVSGTELIRINQSMTSNSEHSTNKSQDLEQARKQGPTSKSKKKRRYRGVEYD